MEHRLLNSIALDRKNSLIVFFIYVSVFINSIVFFREPFEFYLGYLIYILLLPIFIARYGFNRFLIFVFSMLLITGTFNMMLGNNTPALFFKVFTGLTLSYFFYYYVIVEFDLNVEQLFRWYMKGSFVASLIGLIQFVTFQVGFEPGYNYRWILNKWGVVTGGNFGIRVNSVFGEPTYLGAVLSAAFFVALHNLIRRQTYGLNRMQSIVVIVVYFLSFSGLGQVGILLSLIFLALNYGLVRYFVLAIPLAILVFDFMYDNIPDFRERYDSIITLFTTGEFVLGKTHGSSFILYNNFQVATSNFKEHFLFGSGLGSHPIAFDKFSVAKNIGVYGFNLNSADANSMLLRLISETGLFGVSIFIFIIFKFYVPRDVDDSSHHWLISNGILVMMLLNLLRQGHYFLNGFPFFVLLYIYNWYASQQSDQEEKVGTQIVALNQKLNEVR